MNARFVRLLLILIGKQNYYELMHSDFTLNLTRLDFEDLYQYTENRESNKQKYTFSFSPSHQNINFYSLTPSDTKKHTLLSLTQKYRFTLIYSKRTYFRVIYTVSTL